MADVSLGIFFEPCGVPDCRAVHGPTNSSYVLAPVYLLGDVTLLTAQPHARRTMPPRNFVPGF